MKILITSALLYANGELHPGHVAGAYLPADVYARFQRLRGHEVLYISGSDEYGIAITLSAELEGRSPKQQVDHYDAINRALFQRLGISFDHYSRTTWEGHVEPVQQYFLDLLNNGLIEEKVTDQLYSEEEKRFLADRYVVGTCPRCGFDPARGDECPKCGASYELSELKNPRSKLSGAKLTVKPTKHWFLLLDKMKDRILAWLETKNWKPNVVNFIKDYVGHMHPRSITRDMTWGVPIPLKGTEDKVLYVWFDAPIGYISATMEWAKGTDKWKDYWLDPETKLVHFIGKDNIPFHAAIFPAMTMGQNTPYKLVDEIPANEFYNYEGKKFSKSEGWFLDIGKFLDKYSSDQLRYAIGANAPETTDSEFTWQEFQNRCNAELLGKYGNLVNRILVFTGKQCDGKVPDFGPLDAVDKAFLAKIEALTQETAEAYEEFKLRKACRLFIELAQEGNVYFDLKKPWVLAKEDRKGMETTVRCCIECLRALALISYPVIPTAAEKVLNMLGIPLSNWQGILDAPLKEVQKPEILFRRIEDEEIAKEVEQLQSVKGDYKPEISYDDMMKIDVRVGQILGCEEVPKSKKLYKLLVDLGSEKRTIVSGIREYYETEELIGRKVLVVANLAPAKLMGIESQGMILAACSGKLLELPGVGDIPLGASIQ